MDKALQTAFKVKRDKDVHVGPIVSAVPGRTDDHAMKVPAGAYVVNADTVSHLGQNNSMAGLKVLEKMFARYRTGKPKPKKAAGGAIDIMAAGGEYVIEPEVVAAIGGGNLQRGHRILDKWMQDMRKDHIKTLKSLPGPAKA